MSDECIFCKIARKEVPTQPVYEDHDLLAFDDIHPVAPVHAVSYTHLTLPTIYSV